MTEDVKAALGIAESIIKVISGKTLAASAKLTADPVPYVGEESEYAGGCSSDTSSF